MIIRDVEEPKASREMLDYFEKKYGYDSHYFYTCFQLGVYLIKDEIDAMEWAFEYEVNKKTTEKQRQQKSSYDRQAGGHAPGFLSYEALGEGLLWKTVAHQNMNLNW